MIHDVKVVDVESVREFEKHAENLLDMGYEMKDFRSYVAGSYPDYSSSYVAVFIKKTDNTTTRRI